MKERDRNRRLQNVRERLRQSVPAKRFASLKLDYSDALTRQKTLENEMEEQNARVRHAEQELASLRDNVEKQTRARSHCEKQFEVREQMFSAREEEYLRELASQRRRVDELQSELGACSPAVEQVTSRCYVD